MEWTNKHKWSMFKNETTFSTLQNSFQWNTIFKVKLIHCHFNCSIVFRPICLISKAKKFWKIVIEIDNAEYFISWRKKFKSCFTLDFFPLHWHVIWVIKNDFGNNYLIRIKKNLHSCKYFMNMNWMCYVFYDLFCCDIVLYICIILPL